MIRQARTVKTGGAFPYTSFIVFCDEQDAELAIFAIAARRSSSR